MNLVYMHYTLRILRVVPETKEVLMAREQKQIVDELGYNLEVYFE